MPCHGWRSLLYVLAAACLLCRAEDSPVPGFLGWQPPKMVSDNLTTIEVNFINRCRGNVDLFWVDNDPDERREHFMFKLEHQSQNHLKTSIGNFFVAKFTHDHTGQFGKDIIETWRIKEGPAKQDINLCEDQANDINVTFVNRCPGPLDLFWLHYNNREELFQFQLPQGHMNHIMTHPNRIFRTKYSYDNRGIFGEDILEEWIIQFIEQHPTEQEIRLCDKHNEL